MSTLVKKFDPLTPQQILTLRPGSWADQDLMGAVNYFQTEKKDRDRAMAVAELILCSSQIASLDYSSLYLDLIGYYRWKGNFPVALRWAHALITFDVQHEDDINHGNNVRELAETYLEAGDLDTGLGLFTRMMQISPGDIWNYNALGFALPRAGLPNLALEVLDHALTLTAKNDPEQLKKHLADRRRKVGETVVGTPDQSSEISPDILADFRAALIPISPPKKRKSIGREESAPYLPPITQLIAASPTDEPALEVEILAQGKVLVPELIRLAFDEDLPVRGAPDHAVRLLHKMCDAKIAELGELSAWLDKASGDWRNELLTRHVAKIGGYTTSELETIVGNLHADTFTRTSALEDLAERVERLPALRKRFIAFIRTMLTRPEADTASEETIIGFLISEALELEARELYPEIMRAFVEDRVDTSVVSPMSVQHHWGLLPKEEPIRRSDGMYLRLRCTNCDRIREHFVQNVILDLNTPEQEQDETPIAYDPYIMDHEIICPKCGTVDHYAMTPNAHLTLLVMSSNLKDLTAFLAGQKSISDLPPNPRLHPIRSAVFGQLMHPLAGLEEYRRRIAASPMDARLYMQMGTLLRSLYRYSAALKAHRQAYLLNPNDVEIALALGFSEHDFGEQADAKKMYERVLTLELKGVGAWGNQRPDTFAGAAIEGLNLLKRSKPSAWALPAYNQTTGKNKLINPNAQTPSASSRKRRRRKRH